MKMFPDILQNVLKHLNDENRVLVEYKILGNISTTTTIVLKYGDHDLPIQASELIGRPRGVGKPLYRSPSQVNRDNNHVKSWPYAYSRPSSSSRASDSGLFTPETAGQGPFCSSAQASRFENREWKSPFPNSSGLFDKQKSIDAEVQCPDTSTESCPMLDAETSTVDVECIDNGVQCPEYGEYRTGLTHCGVQCGTGEWNQKSVGVTCFVQVNQNSKRSQTPKVAQCNQGVGCISNSKDRCIQTVDNPKARRLWQQSVGCQVHSETQSRHSQTWSTASSVHTQTYENGSDLCKSTSAESSLLNASAKVVTYLNSIKRKKTQQTDYSALINDNNRNKEVHHIIHCTSTLPESFLNEYMWVLFDDLAVCYQEKSLNQLTYSHYLKFYGTQWGMLFDMFSQPGTHVLSANDPRYYNYKLHAQSNIDSLIQSIRVFHPP